MGNVGKSYSVSNRLHYEELTLLSPWGSLLLRWQTPCQPGEKERSTFFKKKRKKGKIILKYIRFVSIIISRGQTIT